MLKIPGMQAKKDYGDVRQRIIDAATELFANKGYSASSISDISTSANVNRALIYYYFKDKYDLYHTILKEGNDADIRLAEEIYAKDMPSIDKLKEFVARFSKMREQNEKSIGRIIMRGIVDNSPETEGCMDEGFSRMVSILKQIICDGIDNGELKDIDPEKTAHIIIGMGHSVFMMQTKDMIGISPEECVNHAIRILANGISAKPL